MVWIALITLGLEANLMLDCGVDGVGWGWIPSKLAS